MQYVKVEHCGHYDCNTDEVRRGPEKAILYMKNGDEHCAALCNGGGDAIDCEKNCPILGNRVCQQDGVKIPHVFVMLLSSVNIPGYHVFRSTEFSPEVGFGGTNDHRIGTTSCHLLHLPSYT